MAQDKFYSEPEVRYNLFSFDDEIDLPGEGTDEEPAEGIPTEEDEEDIEEEEEEETGEGLE